MHARESRTAAAARGRICRIMVSIGETGLEVIVVGDLESAACRHVAAYAAGAVLAGPCASVAYHESVGLVVAGESNT